MSDPDAPVYKAQVPGPNVTSTATAPGETKESAAARGVLLDSRLVGLGGVLAMALVVVLVL